jgi:integrase
MSRSNQRARRRRRPVPHAKTTRSPGPDDPIEIVGANVAKRLAFVRRDVLHGAGRLRCSKFAGSPVGRSTFPHLRITHKRVGRPRPEAPPRIAAGGAYDDPVTVRKPSPPPPPKARRRKGTGTAYQRKDGLWVAEITMQGRVSRRTAKTEQLAEARLHAYLDGGESHPDDATAADELLGSYLPRWIEECPRLNDRTRHGYRAIIRLHILPTLGGVRIRELSPTHTKRMLAIARANGIGPSTQRNIKNTLSSAISDLIEEDVLAFNPTAVRVARGRNAAAEVSIGLAEAANLMNVIQGHPMEDLWALALYTGGRIGELLALAWEDVHLADHKILIRRADSMVVDPKDPMRLVRGITVPKTPSSIREVPLAEPEAVDLMTARWERMGRPRRGLVFPSAHDPAKPINRHDASHRFTEVLAAAGHPHITQHTMRHWAATLMTDSGCRSRWSARFSATGTRGSR